MTGSLRLRITAVGPVVTVQDGGRTGGLRFGIPRSGPMDRLAHAAANAALGRPHGSSAIEISAGGCTFVADRPATVAVTAGTLDLDGRRLLHGDGVVTVPSGGSVSVAPSIDHRWAYLAVTGDLRAPAWLGSTATHAASGLGGGRLVPGDDLVVDDADARPDLDGPIAGPTPSGALTVRAVLGPQDRAFEPAAVEAFSSAVFVVTAAADRMGVRLDGPPLTLADALTLPSEPIVRGAVQVAGDGVPTVLLADHQTTGGYPKIATVISTDTDRLAQAPVGCEVSFRVVSAAEAVTLVRSARAEHERHLHDLASPERTLAQRLARRNLISGADPSTW